MNENQSEVLKDTLLNNKARKKVIEEALNKLKSNANEYLTSFESTRTWARIEQAFAIYNVPTSLNKLVNLKLCQIKDPQESYFNPFQKIPITICYNKIPSSDFFNKILTYNLILLHDTRCRQKMNWNNINHVANTTIRALNISQICLKKDIQCYKSKLKSKVEDKQRFVGIKYNFQQIFDIAIQDLSPINQLKFK